MIASDWHHTNAASILPTNVRRSFLKQNMLLHLLLVHALLLTLCWSMYAFWQIKLNVSWLPAPAWLVMNKIDAWNCAKGNFSSLAMAFFQCWKSRLSFALHEAPTILSQYLLRNHDSRDVDMLHNGMTHFMCISPSMQYAYASASLSKLWVESRTPGPSQSDCFAAS